MRSLLVVAAREIRERQALAALPLLLAILPHFGRLLGLWTALDSSSLAVVLSVALAIVTTFVVGASVVGRDLGQHRLGFYFSRPLPWWSIWGGKMLSGLMLSLLTALPFLVALAMDKDLMPSRDPWRAGLFVAWVLLGLGVAHFASLVYRSRSPWAAVDFGLLALAGIWLFAVGVRIHFVHSMRDAGNLWLAVLLGSALTLLLASAIGFSKGRTSERRGRAFASAVTWSLMLPSLLGLEWHVRTTFITPPALAEVVTVVSAQPGPGGNWLRIRATTSEPYRFQALYDTERARLVAATRMSWLSNRLAVSAGGRWVAWTRVEMGFWQLSTRLYRQALTLPAARAEALPIDTHSSDRVLALTSSGSRLLALRGSKLDLLEIPNGRVLNSTPLGAQRFLGAFFEDEQTVRLYSDGNGIVPGHGTVFLIRRLHADTGDTQTAGRIDLPPGRWLFTLSPNARGVLAQDFSEAPDAGCSMVFDALTGERTLSLGECGARPDALLRRGVGARFLADGRLVVVRHDSTGARLDLVSPQGETMPVIGLGRVRILDLGGEVSPGCLVVGLAANVGAREPNEWRVIDVDAGTAIGGSQGRLMVEREWIDPTTTAPAGSLSASCFVVDGRLLRWDATAREARQLLPLAQR